jgi:hypothetical protein
MPKLLVFAPCEKIIVDQTTNTTSVINLLEALNIAIPQDEESKIPADANLAMAWHILALWQAQPEDEGKQFEQRFVAELPSGEALGLMGIMPIAFEAGKPNFRNIVNILGFPIARLLKTDRCVFRLFFREQGDANPWQLVAEFPLVISHVTQPMPAVTA